MYCHGRSTTLSPVVIILTRVGSISAHVGDDRPGRGTRPRATPGERSHWPAHSSYRPGLGRARWPRHGSIGRED